MSQLAGALQAGGRQRHVVPEVRTAQRPTTRCPRSRTRTIASAIPSGQPEVPPFELPNQSAVVQFQQSLSSASPLQALQALTAPMLKGGHMHWRAALAGSSAAGASGSGKQQRRLAGAAVAVVVAVLLSKLPFPLHYSSSLQT